jgi:hypothetical protein
MKCWLSFNGNLFSTPIAKDDIPKGTVFSKIGFLILLVIVTSSLEMISLELLPHETFKNNINKIKNIFFIL